MDIISTNLTRAERDNDLIYHYDVPSFSQLPPVQEIAMVKSVVPPGLQDYATDADVERDGLIFSDLLGWGAKVAIGASGVDISCLARRLVFADDAVEDIYKERVNNWLKTEVLNKVEELDAQADQYVHSSSSASPPN